MRPIGRTAARVAGRLAALALLVLVGGCATTDPKPKVVLTGDLLVDGPKMIEQGPPRDKVLWEYRTAVAEMRVGNYGQAKQYLDEALRRLQGIYGTDADAKKARSYFNAEAKKTFLGEPYERSMAYIYRGIIYWMDGEPDNARACFRSAEFQDSDTEKKEYAGDWVLPDYLDGFITTQLGGDGADAYRRAEAEARGIKLPPFNPKANLILFFELGPGPVKFSTGEYHQELRFRVANSPVQSIEFRIDTNAYPAVPTDDVWYQASTRGGRAMDHILGNKAVFKTATDAVGTAAIIGGFTTAAASGNSTGQQIGLGIAAVGLIAKVISASTTPAADTRSWDNLPRYLSFAALELAPGRHTLTVEFKNSGGGVVSNFTKTITFEIPADGNDKVLFVSDQSLTPQTL